MSCATHRQPAVEHDGNTKALFESIVNDYHLPSADAVGEEKRKLLEAAADGYERLLRDCDGQSIWCAQALRSLGNVRVEQGRLEEAIEIFRRVGKEYSDFKWLPAHPSQFTVVPSLSLFA
ncbi:MAG: tetratricopeptide repeat protein [Verrucomicrobia bacterium]|nr:tetratricopeptide repeat protein [Verrucomicrobiota bacterium]